MSNREAFTLVELMIVVAIIGILAAIAIPNFVTMQYRSKRAEVPPNVDGIRVAENAYEAMYDTFLQQLYFVPSSHVGKQQQDWLTGTNFDTLGWAPDGKVRSAYKVRNAGPKNFKVFGICDVDGDRKQATYTATRSIGPTLRTPENVY